MTMQIFNPRLKTNLVWIYSTVFKYHYSSSRCAKYNFFYFDGLCTYQLNKPNKLSTIALEMFYELIPSLYKRKLQEEIIYIEHVWPSIFQKSIDVVMRLRRKIVTSA